MIKKQKKVIFTLNQDKKQQESSVKGNDAIILLANDGSILYINNFAAQLHNCESDSVLNLNYFDLCKKKKITPLLSRDKLHSSAKEKSQNKPIRARKKLGKTIEWNITQIQPGILLLIGRDIDYYHAVQRAMKAQDYLDNVLQHIPCYIYWKDKNSVYVGCNELFASVAGLKSPEEIVGKTDYDLAWGKTEAELFRKSDQEALNGHAKLNFEEPQRQADGRIATVLASKIPMLNKTGEIIGILGVYLDITERKKMEADLLYAKECAEAASHAKTMFLANMSHDIKTPIAGIVSTAEYLTHSTENPDLKGRADDIVQSGLRLLELMIEIIEVSRLEFKQTSRTKTRFELKQLINDIVQLIKPAIAEKPFKLNFRYDNKIPRFLIGDRWHLYRVILNLLSNAIKFTLKGSITIKTQVVEQSKKEITIKINVTDTGIGIPKDKQAVIFDEFTRLTPSYEGIYKGTGLGLYIVKQFMEAMDGEIYVDSEEKKGSTFTCILPFKIPLLQDGELQDDDTKENKNLLENIFPTFNPNEITLQKGIKVLLVEDNLIAARAAQGTLQSLGCDVEIANTGKEATKLFEKDKYNLIYMDLGLPDMDGVEVAKQIREAESASDIKTPIIALSAHVNDDIKTNCLNSGMNDVLTKPLLRDKAKLILGKIAKIKQLVYEHEKTPEADKLQSKQSVKTATSELKVIDLELGASIIGATSKEAKETIGMLIETFPESQDEMEKAYQKKDFKQLEKAAHKTHGGVAYTGAVKLQKALRILVDTIRANNLNEVDKLYKNACSEMDELIKSYKKL